MKIIRPTPILDSGGSFTRASTATYYNSAGVLSTAAVNTPRINYDPVTLEHLGLLLEAAATNLVLNSSTLTTQSVTLSAIPYVLSFIGTGTVTLTGGYSGSLVGSSSSTRTTLLFTPSAGSTTLTVIGSCTLGQLEAGLAVSSYIPTIASPVTRSADVVTGTGMIYSNLTETDYPTWNAATSYALPTRVIRTTSTTHKIYECLNVTATVNAGTPETTPTRWLEISPTNKWGMFDEQVGTNTIGGTTTTYLLKPGRVNSLALLELDAGNIEVSLVSGTEIVYKASVDLNSGNSVGNWYQYFYEPIYQQTSLLITNLVDTSLLDIPAYGEAVLAITIRGAVSTSVGVLVAGISADLGHTQSKPKLGIVDYSRKEPDDFGNFVIVKRKYSKKMSVTVMLKSSEVDGLVNILSQYRATPLVWVGADSLYTSLIVYGFYKDFDVSIDNILYSSCDLEIEGLT